MPPKVKITKEDIIKAAIDIVKRDGAQGINARTIAAELKCSTQPIFSNFATMEQLHFSVVEKVDDLCNEYMQREEERGEYPPYKAHGMAYISFAKEEKELFKLLYMRDRSQEKFNKESSIDNKMFSMVHNNTGLSDDKAKLFHLEMWAYVHGIAAMFATGFVDLDWSLVSQMLTDAYMGLRKQYETE